MLGRSHTLLLFDDLGVFNGLCVVDDLCVVEGQGKVKDLGIVEGQGKDEGLGKVNDLGVVTGPSLSRRSWQRGQCRILLRQHARGPPSLTSQNSRHQ